MISEKSSALVSLGISSPAGKPLKSVVRFCSISLSVTGCSFPFRSGSGFQFKQNRAAQTRAIRTLTVGMTVVFFMGGDLLIHWQAEWFGSFSQKCFQVYIPRLNSSLNRKSSMDIHSCHIRIIIPLNHTQKFPAIFFIKIYMVCNQIDRSDSL